MRISIYFALLSLLALAACNEESKVLKTPSGVEYINHTSLGGELPQPGDYVYFHAEMSNGDSTIFSSRSQGATPFMQIPEASATNQPPNPLSEVLALLSEGDSATVIINIDTLPQKPPGFENTDVLYYYVSVDEIMDKEQYREKQEAEIAEKQAATEALKARKEEVYNQTVEQLEAYKAGSLGDQLQETDSGLKYVILEDGTGPDANPGNTVDVHYYGMLTDGKEFDNSFGRGQAFNLTLGQNRVIRGWEEGLALLKEGSKAILFIPYELGYGEQGAPPNIPGKSELVFYVEILDVK
jgi:FKBP-type peptidyl-prolyl cis-trans isomerase FkpA